MNSLFLPVLLHSARKKRPIKRLNGSKDGQKSFFNQRFPMIAVLSILLYSCAQLPQMPSTPADKLKSWRLNGRIAISTPDDNWTANVYWRQQDQAYQLRFNMPLGQGAVLLEGDDKEVMMRTANHETFKASNPDALVTQVLKIEIPVSHLHYWIRGIPTPKVPIGRYTLDDAQRLHHLQQDGWEIVYGRYVNVYGLYLPNKIFLENDNFKVKLVISQWNLSNDKDPPKPLRVHNN